MSTLTYSERSQLLTLIRFLSSSFPGFHSAFSQATQANATSQSDEKVVDEFFSVFECGALDGVLTKIAKTVFRNDNDESDFFVTCGYSSSSLSHVRSSGLVSGMDDRVELAVLNSLRNLVVEAVEEGNPGRSGWIKTILGLRQGDQKELMGIIEGGRLEEEVDEGVTVASEVVVETLHHQNRSSMSQSISPSPSPKHQQELSSLQSQLKTQTAAYNSLQAELSALKEANLQTSLRNELALLDRQSEINAKHEREMDMLRKENKKLMENMSEFDRLREGNVKMKDEIDILRDENKELTPMRDKLKQYKEKLVDITDLKVRLAKQEEMNCEMIDKVVVLERDNKQIGALKKTVEQYRNRATEMEVMAGELEGELARNRKAAEKLARLNVELSRGSELKSSEAEKLRSQLLANSNLSNESDMSTLASMGNGLTELNPELHGEILRLRQENKAMKSIVEEGGEEKLTQLRNDLEDEKNKTEQFKNKMNECKEELGRATEKIVRLEELIRCERQRYEREVEEKGVEFEHCLQLAREKSRAASCLVLRGQQAILSEARECLSEKMQNFEAYKSAHSASNIDVKNKIRNMKSEMTVAVSRAAQLESELDMLQNSRRRIERENVGLREDIERIKKNGGGNGGGNLMLACQLENVQNEFKVVVSENKKLREKLAADNVKSTPIRNYSNSNIAISDSETISHIQR